MRPSFTRDEIEHFLADYGYTSNPEKLKSPFPVDYISETEGVAYLDVSADAVRKGNEVPDRPVRITFHAIFDGVSSRWKLKSVEELAPGVKSNALDRHQDTPKDSPWPNKVATGLMSSTPGWIEIPTAGTNVLFQFQDSTMTIFPDGSWRCVAPHGVSEQVAKGKLALLQKFLQDFAAANPL